MSEFGEIFRHVWHEFQHITDIISHQVSEATNLVSQAESSSRFLETHTGLVNQTRETIWRAYNNEKKLKKFYYKFETIIRSIERSLTKASQNFSSCVSCTNSLQLGLVDYTENQIPKFLTKVKETGNHFKIQVNKLIWQEDETADSGIENYSNKQPKIFFSNKILSVYCKDVSTADGCSKKGNCPKTLEHFSAVFEITASVFSNLNNLSRILLYIKLCMEKFGLALTDLKKLALNKLKFYQNFEKDMKTKVTNEKIYKIIARFIKIQNFLEEQVKKLTSFIEKIPKQLIFCSSACISIPIFQTSEQKDMSSVILKVTQQVSLVIQFINNLLNQVVKKKTATSKSSTFIQERSFLFIIFHLRSILLAKMQPYTLSINLKRYSHLLHDYLKESSLSPCIEKLISVKIINGKKHTRASISSSKHLVHSYNSSWDLQENFDNFELEFDETLEFHRFSAKQRKNTQKISRTPDFSPVVTHNYQTSKTRKSVLLEVRSAALPSVQNTIVSKGTQGTSDNQGTDFDFMKKMKKLRNANAGFLSHRIQRIQNNRSISPLTKIEYIREEFANEFRPTGLKLKNSLLKLKNKSTFLYTMK